MHCSRSFPIVILAATTAGCAIFWKESPPTPVLRYVGSSTIANFIRDAEPVYGRVQFVVDTEPESYGGELAIREGQADLAGFAGNPHTETLDLGVAATLIGKDAIAVIVHADNPVADLTRDQLKSIFSGGTTNWKDVGGPDLAVRPFIVGEGSATRKIFRSIVLGEAGYDGCEVVQPDEDLLGKVEAEPGGIGQISFSFLGSGRGPKTVAVDGHKADPTDPDYPITRPLHLLWWPRRERVKEFIAWTSSPEAQEILLRRFAKAEGDS